MHTFTLLTRTFARFRNTPSPTTPIRPRAVEVDTSYNCPNINCKIYEPHTYHDYRLLTPPPADVPLIHLQRFDITANPFPNMNCWEVVRTSPSTLQRERVVYTEQYGLVQLQEKAAEHDKDGWKVFLCVDKEEEVVAEIVVKWDSQKQAPDDESVQTATDGDTGRYRLLSFLCSPF
jgi:hypothetical protein